MKSKILIFVILVVISGFVFTIVRITNRNIEEAYKNSYKTAFQLLAVMADNYLKGEKELNKVEINNLKEKGFKILEEWIKEKKISFPEDIEGLWIFRDSVILENFIKFPDLEEPILDFYKRELMNKLYGTLLNIGESSFYLVNITQKDYNILLLSKKDYGRGEISEIFDSLVTSSNLLYFSILDENNSPILYSSIYEEFLPLKGEGLHILETPVGKIFQIEGRKNGERIIAGFSMKPLLVVTSINMFLLILIILTFSVLIIFFLYKFTKFENFRIDKEREIRHLEELSALSSGFSHELRNSLNTLSLLAKQIEKEEGRLLKEEVKKMNLVMDSLRLLTLSKIDKKIVDLESIIRESISLVNNKKEVVKFEIESSGKLVVEGNRVLLVSAFSNIIKNALEAEASKIKIILKKAGNTGRILFVDNGKGIEKEKIPRVFEPFYSDKKQSGLGLYLTKKIIEAHGGNIRISSGKETMVDILLPING